MVADHLAARIDGARRAWPQIDVPTDHFAAYLQERVADGDVEQRHVDELYLACACLAGVKSALNTLEREYLVAVQQALGRMRVGALLEDAMQVLRQRLLMADGERRPRLADYAGRGSLQGWLRVMAVRLVLDELDKRQPEVLVDDPRKLDDAALAVGVEPELGGVRPEERAAFKQAFEAAFLTLTARQQNLLRQQIVDGLTIDDLGSLYRVHRATAARWLQEIRGTLLFRTREAMQRSGLTDSACEQVLTRAQSQLDLSLSRLFATTPR